MSNLHGLDAHITGNWGEDSISDEDSDLAAHLVDDLFAKELAAAALVCAEPDCEQPVEHRCHGCGMRLCGECLNYHALDGCADAHAAAEWCAEEFALELADARETEDTTMASNQCDNCGFTDGVTESVINGERRVLCASCWDDVETVTRDRERERGQQSDWQYSNPLDPNGFWGW